MLRGGMQRPADDEAAAAPHAGWAAHLPPSVHARDVDLLAAESLPRAWARHFAAAPERPALGDADGRWISYGELDARSRAVAARLAAAGLSAGERLLLSASPSIDVVVAYVAAQRLGLVVVPANTAYTQREVEHIVAGAQPAGAIVDEQERAAWVRGARVVCDPRVELQDGPEPPLDRARREDPALIIYTSGTTGAPKGAVLSSGNLLACAEALRLAWRWTPEDRLVLALPLFHVHGLGVGLHGTLTTGASALLLPRFDVDAVLDAVEDERTTLFFGVPTMYAKLVESPRCSALARLRLCVSGSAALPERLHEQLVERTGQRVLERYGATETAITISNPHDGERRAGTIGVPVPGVEARLAADGEIQLRGPSVFSGYLGDPDATREAFTDDGWFRSGDVGSRDDDGYLRVVGRIKELIISGGYNVYPREVEDVLIAHPRVQEVAVAGVPSEQWGETVGAWIVPAGELDLDELAAFAAARLAGYKRPRLVRVVDALPRNALGKVVRHELPGVRSAKAGAR
jgi:malonyl-CoA/methylmalonyl-CoA synthetase